MKKLLTMICAFVLLAVSCQAALAAPPSISVGDNCLNIKYDNPSAQGGITYVLLDAMEQIALVEINAGSTWSPEWTEEGLYKIRVYYVDADGVTRSEESDFTEVRFENKRGPLYWQDFLGDSSSLPSTFSKPAEYDDPTPAPTYYYMPLDQSELQAGVPVYTFAPSQPTPTPAPVTAPTATYPGTRPCFEHLNIRIRISDNDKHEASVGRDAPGTENTNIVATLNIGEVFQVLDCRIVENGSVHWFLINKNGTNCWVASGRCERY